MQYFRRSTTERKRAGTAAIADAKGTKLAGILLTLVTVVGIMAAEEASVTTSPKDVLKNLVNEIQAKWPDYVFTKTDSKGKIYGLTLPAEYATDQNLVLLTNLPELSSLKIFASDRRKVPTATGVATLTNLPHLSTLSVDCGQQWEAGVFDQICKVKTLRILTLNAATPQTQEYSSLTNLLNLEDLAIYGATNFGDADLIELKRLPHLKQLVFSNPCLTSNWSSIVENFRALTNVVIWKNGSKDAHWKRKN